MAYFDNASTTYPKPKEMYDFMDQFYRESGANVGRGKYEQAKTASGLIQDTRARIKKLLHCPTKDVIFTPTATIALNMILQGIIKENGSHVYISPFEHNAVTRTLQHYVNCEKIELHILNVDDNLKYNLQEIKYQFDLVKPDLVIMSHASNAFGIVSPIEDIMTLAKTYDATTVVDMAQTAGLIDCNIGLDAFDFAVFAGHKTLYGPTGISGFVMKKGVPLEPVLFGGTGYDSANQNMPDSIPEKYEMGTLNIAGIAGLNAALRWHENITIEAIRAKEQENRKRLLDLLSDYDFIQVIGNKPDIEYAGIVSCLIKGISSDSAGTIFDKQGIAVRTGLQCAPLAHKFFGTFPAGTIRFSVSYFTSDEDFEQLENALDYIDDNL